MTKHLFLKTKLNLLIIVLGLGCVAKTSVKTEIPSQSSSTQEMPAWTQWAPEDQFLLRVLTKEKNCPVALVDGKSQKLSERSDASKKFPLKACELRLPLSVKTLKVQEKELQVPRRSVKKIVIFGDTGCRVKTASYFTEIQACNDPNAWPLQKIADSIAKLQPDLVIHTGDFLYRESACPKNKASCQGSPVGDLWDTWDADFFTPAQNLLSVSPWIFIRGNHELCERGGLGWDLFFDPRPKTYLCQDQTEPYLVHLEGLELVILDSANANDVLINHDSAKLFARQIEKIKNFGLKQSTWLLSHRPFWYQEKRVHPRPGLSPPEDLNGTLHGALELAALPKAIDQVISGHVHLFDMLSFEDEEGPSQIIVGNGGTSLLSDPMPLVGKRIHKRKVKSSQQWKDFGFLEFTLEDTGQWKALVRRPDGSLRQECVLEGKKIRCGNAAD